MLWYCFSDSAMWKREVLRKHSLCLLIHKNNIIVVAFTLEQPHFLFQNKHWILFLFGRQSFLFTMETAVGLTIITLNDNRATGRLLRAVPPALFPLRRKILTHLKRNLSTFDIKFYSIVEHFPFPSPYLRFAIDTILFPVEWIFHVAAMEFYLNNEIRSFWDATAEEASG